MKRTKGKKIWKCDKCGKTTTHLQIHWGTSGNYKVDILDYFCPHCPSNELTFDGTEKEKEAYWDMEWSK